jgi:hypothetical protein
MGHLIELIKDTLKILVIEYLPNKAFCILYSIPLIRIFRDRRYNQPLFLKKNQIYAELTLKTSSRINAQKKLHSQDNAANGSGALNLVSNQNILYGKVKKFRALVVIPTGWLNSEGVGGRTQGPQIEFLIRGLKDNNIEIQTFEFGESVENLITLEAEIFRFDAIFIWSLTIIRPSGEFFELLARSAKSKSFSNKLIGIITASPSENRLKTYNKWASVIKRVVYYEEDSYFKRQLDQIFEVIHYPFLQLNTQDSPTNYDFATSIHSSSLLKFNRAAWLISLRYQCLILGIKLHIRTMSTPLAARRIRKLYLSNEFITAQRSEYGFGFVMVHRNPDEDAHLIGSFWDYYRIGVIPIVQMQSIKPIATYLTPYLDYIPVASDLDLFEILIYSRNEIEYFKKLRKRILHRMATEFTPDCVVRKLLNDAKLLENNKH